MKFSFIHTSVSSIVKIIDRVIWFVRSCFVIDASFTLSFTASLKWFSTVIPCYSFILFFFFENIFCKSRNCRGLELLPLSISSLPICHHLQTAGLLNIQPNRVFPWVTVWERQHEPLLLCSKYKLIAEFWILPNFAPLVALPVHTLLKIVEEFAKSILASGSQTRS